MTVHTGATIARSDVVGSLLRPVYLREARQGVREGRVSAADLRVAEDRAVRDARCKRQPDWTSSATASCGASQRLPGGCGRRDAWPVAQVSWEDVRAFIRRFIELDLFDLQRYCRLGELCGVLAHPAIPRGLGDLEQVRHDAIAGSAHKGGV